MHCSAGRGSAGTLSASSPKTRLVSFDPSPSAAAATAADSFTDQRTKHSATRKGGRVFRDSFTHNNGMTGQRSAWTKQTSRPDSISGVPQGTEVRQEFSEPILRGHSRCMAQPHKLLLCGSTPQPATTLSAAQCSTGSIQSRPFPARTGKIMESAGQCENKPRRTAQIDPQAGESGNQLPNTKKAANRKSLSMIGRSGMFALCEASMLGRAKPLAFIRNSAALGGSMKSTLDAAWSRNGYTTSEARVKLDGKAERLSEKPSRECGVMNVTALVLQKSEARLQDVAASPARGCAWLRREGSNFMAPLRSSTPQNIGSGATNFPCHLWKLYMNPHKELILQALSMYRGDNLPRAQCMFKGMTWEQMQSPHGHSDKTRQQILKEYEAHEKCVDEAIKWLNNL